MPKPFLKDGVTALPAVNAPDTRELPKQPQIPFQPSERKPPSEPSGQDQSGSLSNAVKSSVKNGITP
jgi:hypothetical protein